MAKVHGIPAIKIFKKLFPDIGNVFGLTLRVAMILLSLVDAVLMIYLLVTATEHPLLKYLMPSLSMLVFIPALFGAALRIKDLLRAYFWVQLFLMPYLVIAAFVTVAKRLADHNPFANGQTFLDLIAWGLVYFWSGVFKWCLLTVNRSLLAVLELGATGDEGLSAKQLEGGHPLLPTVASDGAMPVGVAQPFGQKPMWMPPGQVPVGVAPGFQVPVPVVGAPGYVPVAGVVAGGPGGMPMYGAKPVMQPGGHGQGKK